MLKDLSSLPIIENDIQMSTEKRQNISTGWVKKKSVFSNQLEKLEAAKTAWLVFLILLGLTEPYWALLGLTEPYWAF